MKSTGFYIVQGWMINELQLKGNNLILFAIIYGFSQNGEGKYTGSLKYLMGAMNAAKNTVMNSLDSLLDQGYILKESTTQNSVKFCKYYHNDTLVQKLVGSGSNSALGTGSNFGINNTTLDNPIKIEINKENFIEFFKGLKPKEKKEIIELMGLGTTAAKMYFKDCQWCEYDVLRTDLAKDSSFVQKFSFVDLKYYIEQADTWSENKDVKRTERGWYKTLRDWMGRDLRAGKLVKIDSTKLTAGHHNF